MRAQRRAAVRSVSRLFDTVRASLRRSQRPPPSGRVLAAMASLSCASAVSAVAQPARSVRLDICEKVVTRYPGWLHALMRCWRRLTCAAHWPCCRAEAPAGPGAAFLSAAWEGGRLTQCPRPLPQRRSADALTPIRALLACRLPAARRLRPFLPAGACEQCVAAFTRLHVPHSTHPKQPQRRFQGCVRRPHGRAAAWCVLRPRA